MRRMMTPSSTSRGTFQPRDSFADVAGQQVSRIDDLASGAGGLPPTEGLRYLLADDTRVIVRPSGTEPKLKIYLETIDADPAAAGRKLTDVRAEFERLTAAG